MVSKKLNDALDEAVLALSEPGLTLEDSIACINKIHDVADEIFDEGYRDGTRDEAHSHAYDD